MDIPSRWDPSDPLTFCQTVLPVWLSRESSLNKSTEDEIAKSSLILRIGLSCQIFFFPRIVPDK